MKSPFLAAALCAALALPLPALADSWSDVSSLQDESGWENQGTRNHGASGLSIDVWLKYIGGLPCLQGRVTVDVAPDQLLAVATDIPGAMNWSSAPLIASRQLAQPSGFIDYYQHLDVPGWTLAKDRFWVLRGRVNRGAERTSFEWIRRDWRSDYPDLATDIDTNHSGAIEPPTNYGGWVFMPADGGTEVRYYICSDTGGSIPDNLKRTAALQTLPDTVGDLVAAARNR